MFRATLGGFADPDQPELVEPYRADYFGVVGDVWRDWSSAMAQDFVSGLYLAFAFSAETIAGDGRLHPARGAARRAAPPAHRGP